MTDNALPSALLDELIAISKAMVDSAKGQNWDSVARLDALRREQLEALSDAGAAFDPGHLLLSSNALVELDQEVIRLVRAAKAETSGAHKQNRSADQAIRNYRQDQSIAG